MTFRNVLLIFVLVPVILLSCRKDQTQPPGSLQLAGISVGLTELDLQGENIGIPVDTVITLVFNNRLDTASVPENIVLYSGTSVVGGITFRYAQNNMDVIMQLPDLPVPNQAYSLTILTGIKGSLGETFPGLTCHFTTKNGIFTVDSITLNGEDFSPEHRLQDVDRDQVTIRIRFSAQIDTSGYASYFILSPGATLTGVVSDSSRVVTLTSTGTLEGLKKYYFSVSTSLKAQNGFTFAGFVNSFYTEIDSTLKFPLISDDALLTLIQQQTFRYFYEFAHPSCGMARERNTSGDIVTTGGSGFGVMALIVGMERGFITRDEGLTRLSKIIGFLSSCDRFHGAWPHWMNGTTGQTIPFTALDDGADLVETSYMVEGLLTMRQYLDPAVPAEQELIGRINQLVDGVEFDWFTRGQHVLYWHWSPTNGWAMNMQIRGYNETLITYITAASSVTHPVAPEVYHQGYARNGDIMNGNSYYGYILPLGEPYGGPLFFTHYSFLGLDPRNLSDAYANYMEQNVNQSLINWAYCSDNPEGYVGYNDHCWGLTACDNPWGYSAHSPTNDLGVIAPTAAVSALPYTPQQSLNAIRHFYYLLGDHLWGPYGFYDSFCPTEGWWANSYLAIDEGPIVCMVENYRTGLLWDLFMSCPEVQQGLTTLGFTY